MNGAEKKIQSAARLKIGARLKECKRENVKK